MERNWSEKGPHDLRVPNQTRKMVDVIHDRLHFTVEILQCDTGPLLRNSKKRRNDSFERIQIIPYSNTW